MKRFFFILALTFSTASLLAQEEAQVTAAPVATRNLAVEFYAGYSVALGDYNGYDKSNGKSGYASNGWLAQVTFDWMGKRSLGIAVQYTYQRSALLDTAANTIPSGPFKYPLGTGSWSNHFLMAGPVFMHQFNKIHLDVKVMLGGVISASPVFNMTDPVSGQNVKDVGMGLAFQASAGVGYTISPQFTLKFNLGYLAGWPSKSKTYGQQLIGYEEIKDPITGEVIGYEPLYSAPAEYEIKKVISTLNPSLGVVFRF